MILSMQIIVIVHIYTEPPSLNNDLKLLLAVRVEAMAGV